MTISDKVKLYNIYDEAGCEEGGTFEEWSALIKNWLEEKFGEWIDVEIIDTTAGSSVQIMYVFMYCKNTNVGTYFTITTEAVSSNSYNNATQVGCVYNGTRVSAASGTSYYFHSKNLKLLVINTGTVYSFIPLLDISSPAFACVGYLGEDEAAGFAWIKSKTDMYVSYGSDYSTVSYARSTKSGISQKILVPFAVPSGNFFGNGIYKSDGVMMSNFAVYSIGSRYFVDLCLDDGYQCLSVELS